MKMNNEIMCRRIFLLLNLSRNNTVAQLGDANWNFIQYYRYNDYIVIAEHALHIF